jgi:hypothetical protein
LLRYLSTDFASYFDKHHCYDYCELLEESVRDAILVLGYCSSCYQRAAKIDAVAMGLQEGSRQIREERVILSVQ